MNDQILMENYLLVLKGTTEVYVHGTIESSNNDVRETLKDNLNSTLTLQANTFTKMTEHGWYPVNNIDTTQISETLNKLKKD